MSLPSSELPWDTLEPCMRLGVQSKDCDKVFHYVLDLSLEPVTSALALDRSGYEKNSDALEGGIIDARWTSLRMID